MHQLANSSGFIKAHMPLFKAFDDSDDSLYGMTVNGRVLGSKP